MRYYLKHKDLSMIYVKQVHAGEFEKNENILDNINEVNNEIEDLCEFLRKKLSLKTCQLQYRC